MSLKRPRKVLEACDQLERIYNQEALYRLQAYRYSHLKLLWFDVLPREIRSIVYNLANKNADERLSFWTADVKVAQLPDLAVYETEKTRRHIAALIAVFCMN